MLESLGTTTNKKKKERTSLGIKALATGNVTRSIKKEEEQAKLKEMRLMTVDITRGRPGRVCMDM